MTVKELIEELQALPEEMEVMCDNRDIVATAKIGMRFNGVYKEYFSLFDDVDDFEMMEGNLID